MLALRLPKELEDRLEAMAKKTGRTKSYYARLAIVEKLEDLEDIYLAEERMKNPGEPVPLEEVLAKYADELGESD